MGMKRWRYDASTMTYGKGTADGNMLCVTTPLGVSSEDGFRNIVVSLFGRDGNESGFIASAMLNSGKAKMQGVNGMLNEVEIARKLSSYVGDSDACLDGLPDSYKIGIRGLVGLLHEITGV